MRHGRFARGVASLVATCTVALGLALGGPGATAQAARAEPAAPDQPCADALQIGATKYMVWKGRPIASLKQFRSASCGKKWGYVYIWRGFRDRNIRYDVASGVFSHTKDEFYGARTYMNGSAAEYWSEGAPFGTVGQCTSAASMIWLPKDEIASYSPKVC